VVPTISPDLHTSLVVNKETTGMEGFDNRQWCFVNFFTSWCKKVVITT